MFRASLLKLSFRRGEECRIRNQTPLALNSGSGIAGHVVQGAESPHFFIDEIVFKNTRHPLVVRDERDGDSEALRPACEESR